MLALRDDPIMAIATPPGRGAVGVVRISGKHLKAFAESLCQQVLTPRHAHLLTLQDGQGQAIDQVLAIYFPGPHSYTGEDVLELQGHGGTIVMHMVMARCLSLAQSTKPDNTPWLPHLRMAQAREFTQRAYLNQKPEFAPTAPMCDFTACQTEAGVRGGGRAWPASAANQAKPAPSATASRAAASSARRIRPGGTSRLRGAGAAMRARRAGPRHSRSARR